MKSIIWGKAAKRATNICFSNGAWMNWLPPIACIFYTAVSVGSLTRESRSLYLASVLQPNGDEMRIGYFGLCLKNAAETSKSWMCSHFLRPTDRLVQLTRPVKLLQHNVLWPLPSIAAVMLFVLWIAILVVRGSSYQGMRWTLRLLWVSCVIGFAGALIPVALGQALIYAGPLYGSDAQVGISVLNEVLTWIGFGLHASYVGSVSLRNMRGRGKAAGV